MISSRQFVPVRLAGQAIAATGGELSRTRVNCNQNCNLGQAGRDTNLPISGGFAGPGKSITGWLTRPYGAGSPWGSEFNHMPPHRC
jgi:hypothetical protein